MDLHSNKHHLRFTLQIVIGMGLGIATGLLIKWLPLNLEIKKFLAEDILNTGGQIFINIIRMLVVPIVLVSLICGAGSLGDFKRFGRVGGKTFLYYIFTTAIAITIGLLVASFFKVGLGMNLTATDQFVAKAPPTLKQILIELFPSNPFKALTGGYMLQIIVFAVLFGLAMSASGQAGKKIMEVFQSTNEVLMKLITMIMKTAPYGVFCLLGALFARIGYTLISHLLVYFLVVLLVLIIQLTGTYVILLRFIGKFNPAIFFRKMYAAMLFAFSVSSSNASIPIILKTVEKRLGVSNAIASFVIPLGSTINMDGTAIMQGVATVFIANAYQIHLGFIGYLTVISMSVLASIGTAGAPGVGLITLAMVLEQVGLPVAGIGLIIGVDRLLDMARTAVNITGDAVIACVVAKSENAIDLDTFNKIEDDQFNGDPA